MQLHIILVSPARPENVGAAARAMKTMGFASLRIVDSEAHLKPEAGWVAHGSQEILQNALHFTTLAEALADIDFTVATTARSRARFHYYCTPPELLTQLEEKSQWVNHAALVFGREDSGLTNEELELADILTGVPMVADYPSLNLGQAVMVFCYQLSSLNQVAAARAQLRHDAGDGAVGRVQRAQVHRQPSAVAHRYPGAAAPGGVRVHREMQLLGLVQQHVFQQADQRLADAR